MTKPVDRSARQRAIVAVATAVAAAAAVGAAGQGCGCHGRASDSGVTGTTDSGTDAASDAGAAACNFPPPMVGGTAATDALADDPARCGSPAYTWLRDASLGSVLGMGSSASYAAGTLAVLAGAAGVTLPRPPLYDASVRGFSYQTQDRGVLLAATAAVAWPEGLPADQALDVVVILHGTMGFTDGCSASTNVGMQFLAAYFASLGHVVVMPDYIGLAAPGTTTGFPHPYLVGEATAIASLDAVRAVGAMAPADRGGMCVAPRFVTWGASQGGHAVLWVDRLAPYYAPELTALGGVAAVPPADLTTQAERSLSTVTAATGLVTAAAAATPTWYGYGGMLDQILVPPWDTDVPAALAASCNPTLDFSMMTLADVFQPAVLSAASAGTLETLDPFGCVMTENSLTSTSIARMGPGTGAPAYGVLFVLGEIDPIVDPTIEEASFDALCAAGMPLQFLKCAGAGHVEGALWSLGEALDFMDARLAGTPLAAADLCNRGAAVTCSGTQ
jgi:hypothetical protein